MNDLHSPALSEIFKRACQKRRAVHLVHVMLNLLQKVQWIQKLWDPVFFSSISHTPTVCLWKAGKLSEGLQASWWHCYRKAPIKVLCIKVHQSHGGIGECQPTLNREMEMQYFSNLLTSGGCLCHQKAVATPQTKGWLASISPKKDGTPGFQVDFHSPH